MPEKMLSDKICVAVTNYDFSTQADRLKAEFSQYFPTVLIDSSSPVKPLTADITIQNNYYPGLWNAAVEFADSNRFEWLMFVASDVRVPDVGALCQRALEAINIEDVGIYSPSLIPGSRCFFDFCFNKPFSAIREAGIVEGFFFLARISILKELYPIPSENKFGWGVDVAACFSAYKQNYFVVIDDRVEIFHPEKIANHNIDELNAAQLSEKYLGPERYFWMQSKLAEIAKYLNVFSVTSSLDLGCGKTVRNSFEADEAYGLDLVENTDPRIKSADLAIEPIPFEENFFEYVTAFDFIEHVPRLIYCPQRRYPFVELMNEIYRVLKPGGVLLSVTPAYPEGSAFQDPTHVNFITEETFESYFCIDKLWGRMYGFSGAFKLLSQRWEDGKLVTLLRAIKSTGITHDVLAEKEFAAAGKWREAAPQVPDQDAVRDAAVAVTDKPLEKMPSAQPMTHGMPKVGRNDPCPCGSGKRYKHCHGALN